MVNKQYVLYMEQNAWEANVLSRCHIVFNRLSPPQDLIICLGMFTASPIDSVVTLEMRLLGLQAMPQGISYSNILC